MKSRALSSGWVSARLTFLIPIDIKVSFLDRVSLLSVYSTCLGWFLYSFKDKWFCIIPGKRRCKNVGAQFIAHAWKDDVWSQGAMNCAPTITRKDGEPHSLTIDQSSCVCTISTRTAELYKTFAANSTNTTYVIGQKTKIDVFVRESYYMEG